MTAPLHTDDGELIKQLLKGAVLATYDVVNPDAGPSGGTVEPGLSLDDAFEKQWQYIQPHLDKLITSTAANRMLEIIGGDEPERVVQVLKNGGEVVETNPRNTLRTELRAAVRGMGETPAPALKQNPWDFVQPCEPDCSPERHAYHQGQWDMAQRMTGSNFPTNGDEASVQ